MNCLRLTFALALVAGITVLSAPGQLSPIQESAEVRGTGVIPRNHPKWSSTQETAEVHRAAVIPRDHYKTWSLFLICNPEWLSVEKSRSLYDLYRKFLSFGSAIGSDHVAVWFWKSERVEAEWAFKSRESANDTSLADNVDVDRSVAFCQKYQLRPTQGPHILITSKYPDEAAVSDDHAVFALGSMSSKEISQLLGNLTDSLVLRGKVEDAGTATAPPPALWIRLLEAAQRAIGSFGCAWNLKLETGVLSAELHACQKT